MAEEVATEDVGVTEGDQEVMGQEMKIPLRTKDVKCDKGILKEDPMLITDVHVDIADAQGILYPLLLIHQHDFPILIIYVILTRFNPLNYLSRLYR